MKNNFLNKREDYYYYFNLEFQREKKLGLMQKRKFVKGKWTTYPQPCSLNIYSIRFQSNFY